MKVGAGAEASSFWSPRQAPPWMNTITGRPLAPSGAKMSSVSASLAPYRSVRGGNCLRTAALSMA